MGPSISDYYGVALEPIREEVREASDATALGAMRMEEVSHRGAPGVLRARGSASTTGSSSGKRLMATRCDRKP